LNEPDDAANTLVEAFKVYRKDNPQDAVRCVEVAIQRYASKGGLRRAATHQQNKAEVYEVEMGDNTKAAEAYEIAASWFESDNAEAYVRPAVMTILGLLC
jgi:alpha-soluble NSF attachment protein